MSTNCDRVRRLHPDGVSAGLRDVHRVRDPPRRAGRRAAAPVRDQAGRGARAGASASGAGRDRGAAGVPARPDGDDAAAAPVALRARARVPAAAAPLPARAPARRRSRAIRTALGQASRDRRHLLAGPRKIYVKELLQAFALADRLLDAPDVRHLHAHFAHGTTTVTWLAARITGLPFSFTGHARDIYSWKLNRKGWLRRKLRRGAVRRHVHRGQRPPPEGDRARARTSTSSTTGCPRTSRGCSRERRPRADAQRAPARARRRPARGQEGLRHARRRLRRAAGARRRRSTR